MTDAARAKREQLLVLPVSAHPYFNAGWDLAMECAATQTADKDAEIARLTALVVQARDDAKAARADADTFREAAGRYRTKTAALRAKMSRANILWGRLRDFVGPGDAVDEEHRRMTRELDALLADSGQAPPPDDSEIRRLRLKIRDADVVMAAIDQAIRSGHLDSRSPIADARLDYGDPTEADSGQP